MNSHIRREMGIPTPKSDKGNRGSPKPPKRLVLKSYQLHHANLMLDVLSSGKSDFFMDCSELGSGKTATAVYLSTKIREERAKRQNIPVPEHLKGKPVPIVTICSETILGGWVKMMVEYGAPLAGWGTYEQFQVFFFKKRSFGICPPKLIQGLSISHVPGRRDLLSADFSNESTRQPKTKKLGMCGLPETSPSGFFLYFSFLLPAPTMKPCFVAKYLF